MSKRGARALCATDSMPINDAHCHFFSEQFFANTRPSASSLEPERTQPIRRAELDGTQPGIPEELADRWVARARNRASVGSRRADRQRARRRGVGGGRPWRATPPAWSDSSCWTRQRPTRSREPNRARATPASVLSASFPPCSGTRCTTPGRRDLCRWRRTRPGMAMFVHCGALSVGVRQEARPAEPLRRPARQSAGSAAARGRPSPACRSSCPTSAPVSSRSAARCGPVPERAISTPRARTDGWPITRADAGRPCSGRPWPWPGPIGCSFGTDSSFFPRGWNQAVYRAQIAALEELGGRDNGTRRVFSGEISTACSPRPVLS